MSLYLDMQAIGYGNLTWQNNQYKPPANNISTICIYISISKQ